MTTFLRHKVSKNKRRYQEDGFDLDLTYITERIIAMGFPSSKSEAIFRNPLTEVAKFFEKRHGAHYKLYNLCAEKRYDPSKFHLVAEYPFYDHNAPPINLIQECLLDVDNFLKEDPKNAVGINCKAGKGRTGLIICCYLLHAGICTSTDEALKFYGERRTKDGKGVTIASQIRYIRYYEKILKDLHSVIPPAPKVLLSKLLIPSSAKIAGAPLAWIEINNIITHRSSEVILTKKQKGYEITVEGMCEGDCKIQIVHKQGRKVTKVCHFWFNTGFIDPYSDTKFGKAVIDVANKDKKCKIFKSDYSITPIFRPYEPKHEKDEEKYNNWIKISLAKEKEKIKKPPPVEEDLGNDTEGSSVELKVEEEDGDAAFIKREEVVEKPPPGCPPPAIPVTTTATEKVEPMVENGTKLDSEEEKGGRNQSRSIYKSDGYNLDLDLSESDTESEDLSAQHENGENVNTALEGDGIAITASVPKPETKKSSANGNGTGNHVLVSSDSKGKKKK